MGAPLVQEEEEGAPRLSRLWMNVFFPFLDSSTRCVRAGGEFKIIPDPFTGPMSSVASWLAIGIDGFTLFLSFPL